MRAYSSRDHAISAAQEKANLHGKNAFVWRVDPGPIWGVSITDPPETESPDFTLTKYDEVVPGNPARDIPASQMWEV